MVARIWIASYPRSGNTLVRTVLHHSFGLWSGSVYPNDLGGNKQLENYVGHVEQQADGRICFPLGAIPLIKTHGLPRPADASPAIYVVRDGRAACLSLFDFWDNIVPLEDIIQGQVRLGDIVIADWSNHLLAWKPWERPNTLLVRYEDLTNDLPKVIQQLGHFLDVSPIVNRSSARDDIAGIDGKWARAAQSKKSIFPVESVELFEKHHGAMMRQMGYWN